jgi:plastocyanin
MNLDKRPLVVLAALLLTSLALVACGDDDEDSGSSTRPAAAQPEKLAVEVTGTGKDAKLVVPAQAKAGLVEVTFTNASEGEHNLVLVHIDGDAPLPEVLEAGNAWGDKGKPLPSYISFEAGTSSIGAGASTTIVSDLRPGRYMALDFNNEGEGGELTAEFELTAGGAEAQMPETPATLTTKEYAFETQGLKVGSNRVLFENVGREPHHVIAAPLKPGKTKADLVKALQSEDGPPPVDEGSASEVPIISGGQAQVIDVELKKPGKYALVCFIPDRAGGPPHAAKGMVDVVEVS